MSDPEAEALKPTTNGIVSPVFRNGRYQNPPSWQKMPSFWRFLRWRWQVLRGTAEGGGTRVPWSKPEILDKEIPVVKPEFSDPPGKSELNITWIGHATVVVQLDGLTLICDPIWSQRCSPVSFMGPKRYRQPPCEMGDLPELDVAVISHNHYDHLDKATVRALEARFGDAGLRWFVPAGLGAWMRDVGGVRHVEELSWGEEREVKSRRTGQSARVVCLPAQHWSTRNALTDRNASLWAGWALLGPTHRFFFSGDTGYTPDFDCVGRRFGPFDLAAIPIGCYCPRDFMAAQHTDPEGSVKIHRHLGCRKSLGVHWGTFEMGSTEHYLDPRVELKKQVEAAGLGPDEFVTTAIGETLKL